LSFAAGQTIGEAVSATTTALAQEVLRSMLLHKLKLTALTVLLLGAVATGAGYLTHSLAMKDDPPAGAAAVSRPRRVAKSEVAKLDAPAPSRMTVVGRVLDPAGQPVQGVPVDILGRPRRMLPGTDEKFERPVLLARGSTDADGRFRLDAAQTSSVRFFNVCALAAAPELGWVDLNPDAVQPAAEIRLKPEQVVRGRLVDLNGRPAAGVELRVVSFGQSRDLGRATDIGMWDGPPEGARTWPRPLKADDQGRFAFHGLGRGSFVSFAVHDPRFAPQGLDVATDERDGPKEITLALQPAHLIEGRVLTADTGQPLSDAVIQLGGTKTRADAQGRFRLQLPPVDRFSPGDHFGVGVFPPEGQPYPASRVELTWTKGAVKKEIDIKVPRGVVIRGMVTEEGTGRALAEASVRYAPINGPAGIHGKWDAAVTSHNDGSFQIVVPPGKGYLLAFGPTHDYILEVIGYQRLFHGRPGGERNYAHKIITYEVQAGDRPHEINAVLRPGKTIKGRVVGPRGETVEHPMILTRLHIESYNRFWRGDEGLRVRARDSLIELHGLDPAQSVPVYFLDEDHECGAAVALSGKQAGEEVTVQLQPNGQARARFVDPAGKPVAKLLPLFEIVVTPGPPASRGDLLADVARLVQVDPKHYWRPHRRVTDADGRITFPDLIPGALYRICDSATSQGPQVRRDFTVQPGETLDLGEILIENPQ
jgi:protocatechuate 3,4-dioxygenase beta subunit